jgi:Ca2+-binding RTX toxin-like protein
MANALTLFQKTNNVGVFGKKFIIGDRASLVSSKDKALPASLSKTRVDALTKDFDFIWFDGRAGNDVITIDPAITKPVVGHGGDGNDRLTGGSGRNFLFGDLGRDTLKGRGGDDARAGAPGCCRSAGAAGGQRVLTRGCSPDRAGPKSPRDALATPPRRVVADRRSGSG